jgi:hypothetical protein
MYAIPILDSGIPECLVSAISIARKRRNLPAMIDKFGGKLAK